MSYPFPDDVRNPDRKEPNPFAEDVVDEPLTAAGQNENIFSASPADYQPAYEQTYRDRVPTVMTTAIIGVLMSLLGWLSFIGHWEVTLLPLLSVAFSIAAVVLGGSDLKAMDAGVTRKDRLAFARAGLLMGILGLFSSLFYGLIGVFIFDWFDLL